MLFVVCVFLACLETVRSLFLCNIYGEHLWNSKLSEFQLLPSPISCMQGNLYIACLQRKFHQEREMVEIKNGQPKR